MSKSVFCIVPTQELANAIVQRVTEQGVLLQDISVLYPDRRGGKDIALEHHTKAPEGGLAGAGAGGLAGGALGLLAGIGALAIPGLGPFIAAGPILAALSGVAIGATVGGAAGALVGLGIPEFEAKRYEGKLAEGHIFLSVACGDEEQIKQVRETMRRLGATDIAVTHDAAVPKEDRAASPTSIDVRV